MLFSAIALVLSGMDETRITENFTGRVLDGSNDRLTRVERVDVSRRSVRSIVGLQGCGPVEVGTSHEFLTWAGAAEDVLACLAVDGRPHVPELPSGFGVVYGVVHEVSRDASERVAGGVALKAACGDRVFAGKSDARGRFWTMLPAGHCTVLAASEGYRPAGRADVIVRESEAEVMGVRIRPWGILEKIEEWAGSVRDIFSNN
jgi:hypothetical protein